MHGILRSAVLMLLLVAPLQPATAQTADEADFATAGPLGEKGLGDPNAPVVIVEYASLTCSHCGNFHRTTFAALKVKYIDTGKVYFVLREYPLDPLALAAAMIARCAQEEDYFAVIDTMLTEQDNWAYIEDPAPALFALMEPYGLGDGAVAACLNDDSVLAGIVDVAQRGNRHGVAGTPTFFFNGQRRAGLMTIERLDEILEPMLAEEP